MSDSDSGVGRREVAYRLFAAEFEDADYSYSEGNEERAPNYVVTPTGARINRLFVVGVLTEIEQVSDDVLRARVVDPTGAFVVYAGQYQPDVLAFLDRTEPPTFVALTGKARTFQPEDSDRVFTSVRPETMNEVDAETRDRWTVGTAERTLERVATVARALASDTRGDDLREELIESGVDEGFAAGVALALDHYGTTGAYLEAVRDLALDAARVVAGERDEVEPLSVAPDAEGTVDLAALAAAGGEADVAATTAGTDVAEAASGADATADEAGTETAAESPAVGTETAAGTVETDPEPEVDDSGPAAGVETEPEADTVTTDTAVETDGVTAGEGSEPDPDTDTISGDADAEESLGDFEPGEFDLDEETREEVQQEYGTEFQSGTEVDEPGEAGIEPETDVATDESEPAAETGTGTETGTETGTADQTAGVAAETDDASTESVEPTGESDGESEAAAERETDAVEGDEPAEDVEDAEPAEDVDVEDAVMDAMRDLDTGDGAAREDVVASVVDDYGFDPEVVEDAVQDALMDGLCYEPDDDVLKPI